MSISWQFVRFLVVGAINTAFGYAVFATSIATGASPLTALVLTYAIGVPFNYLTTGRFVFRRAGAAFIRFVVAYVVIYAFNVVLYKVVAATGANPLLVQALCVPVVAVFSFLLFRFHVFKDATDT